MLEMFGYAGRILRIDLTRRIIKNICLQRNLPRKFIGGRGIGTYFLFGNILRATDPLGPESQLIFMTGPFAGTIVPNSSRYSVTAKSPLTGFWASSDCGGSWGQELKYAGFDGIVVSGKSDRPTYLWIHEGSVEIRKADHVWGKDTYETDGIIREETDAKAIVASIGPAGENQVKLASIVSNGKDARAAGRAGLGAVMGSKNLKSIVVRGVNAPNIKDEKGLENAVKAVLPTILEKTKGLGRYGTADYVEVAEGVGDLPIKNWRREAWREGAAKITGSAMARSILAGRYYCGRCVIGCGRRVRVPGESGHSAGPEYESLAALGSLCLVDDLEVISKANELCNRYGLDTISTGSVIAFAMEAFEKNLISRKYAIDLDLTWGNGEALIRLIGLIGKKEGIGRILGEGVRTSARRIGGNSEEFAVHVKGLELPMHDPRCFVSLALGYATANRGACHLEAFSNIVEDNVEMPELGYERVLDRRTIEGKGEMVAKMQNLMCVFDSLPVCKFLLFGGVHISNLVDWLNAITGWGTTVEELLRIGERIFNLERLYNFHCGVDRKDDTLPPRILANEGNDNERGINSLYLNKMLDHYYQHRGWSKKGIPTRKRLRDLGLPNPKASSI